MEGGTNLERVRDYNQAVVLEAIRTGDDVSRVEIAAKTGLTAQTVSNIVKRLLNDGLVMEVGREVSNGGKPRVKLQVNPDGGYALGLQIDRDETALVMVNLNGQVMHQARYPTHQEQGPLAIIERVARSVDQLVREAHVLPEKILGLGVACPGPLDQYSGVVHTPPNFFGWHEIPLRDLLAKHTGYTVILDNDAMAAAIGERWAGGARDARNFAFVYTGIGIGAGIFINNHVYRGSTTSAGELGHITLNIEGPPCSCGNRGCVESYCSPASVVAAVRRRLQHEQVSGLQRACATEDEMLAYKMICQAACLGDRLALEEIQHAATMLGYGLVSLVNLLDLELIVLEGPAIHSVEAIFQQTVQKVLAERIMGADWRTVQVMLSTTKDLAVPIGAAALILYEIYAPRLAGLRPLESELEGI